MSFSVTIITAQSYVPLVLDTINVVTLSILVVENFLWRFSTGSKCISVGEQIVVTWRHRLSLSAELKEIPPYPKILW